MRFILSLIMLVSFSLQAEETCSLNELDLTVDSPSAEKLFYVGTCYFRNKNYELAAKQWSELVTTSNISTEFNKLKIDANNNLGYLLFFGYGVAENKTQALTHWKYAISLGHSESEYHLCHAYADKKQPTYNVKKALVHCKKAKLIYQEIGEPDEDEKIMLGHIKKYLKYLS